MGPEPRRPASVRTPRTSRRALRIFAPAGLAVVIAIWLGLSAVMAPFTLAARPAPTPTPTPTPAPCVAEPQLRDVAITQGLPYAKLVRGKETLVRLYLSKKQCVPDSTVMQITGGSLTVQGVATQNPPIPTPLTPLATIPPYSAPITADSTAYPYFVVPGNLLVGTSDAAFTATFRATITFTTTVNGVTTPGTVTFTTKPDGSPFAASVDQKTKALRILVVPMGNTAKAYDTQFTPRGLAAVQQAMQTLSRIYPVSDGVSTLGNPAATGGIRYVVDPGMVNIGDLLDGGGEWCGKGGSTGNFTTVTPRLAAFLNNWNTANTTANDADVVLGVVDDAISKGSSEGGCAEGIAQFIGTVAWIRAIPEDTSTVPATPSKSGALAALEIGHALGLVPTKRDDAYSLYHSPSVKADPNGLLRSFNTSLHSRILDDRTVMTLSGVWNNDTTLLERLDYTFLNCKLGGTMSTECGTAGTTGEITGVAAAPRFVISGTTDGTACGDPCAATEGTHIIESYFSTEVLRTTPGTGNFHLLQKAANGTVLRDDIVRTYRDESVHEHEVDDIAVEPTDVMLINAAVEFNTAAQIIELRNIVPGGANTLLYSRTRDGAPVFSTTDPPVVTGGSDEPLNFTDDPDRDDVNPAVSADGQWLAWSAPFGDFDDVVRVAPTDDMSVQVHLEDGEGDVIESSQPAWCSAGDMLAFVDDGDIKAVDADFSGASPTFLNERTIFYTDDIDYEPDALHPTWSPDCSKLAFEWGSDIFRIDAVHPVDDYTSLVALTNTGRAHWPTWSLTPGDDRIGYMQTASDGIVLLSYSPPIDDGPMGLADHGGNHFTVNSDDDIDETCDATHCSLREAINAANLAANVGALPDVIDFAITGGSPPFTIAPGSPLPTITQPLVIDGTTQTGFVGCVDGPVIELNGAAAGASANGLHITAGESTIRGLVINGFAASGIDIDTSGGNHVECSYIGTNLAGTASVPNSYGVRISGVDDNVVGGETPGLPEGNVISGNVNDGIRVDGATATGNVVVGNFIGTNALGTVAISNGTAGVRLQSAGSNRVGGTTAGARNVISGNQQTGNTAGVFISLGGGSVVVGNYIGTTASGLVGLPNGAGVLISSSSGNTIGGYTPEERNVISGNDILNIFIGGSSATGNYIIGNYVGPAMDGVTALGNAGAGIRSRSPDNFIGDALEGAGNVISGNAGPGIDLAGDITGSPTGNVIQRNLIGVAADGTTAMGNTGNGIGMSHGNNDIGGAPEDGNIIANNTGRGVLVGGGTGSFIHGNSIYANGALGIDLTPLGVSANDAGDGDTGANDLQNFPILTSATDDGITTTINGTLNSAASATYAIEVFSNAACDTVNGNGEGRTLVATGSVTTDGSGDGSFTIPSTDAGTGDVLTATATNPGGSTSEFSQCRTVTGAPVDAPSWVVNTTADTDDGACTTSHCSLREAITRSNSTVGVQDTISFNIPGVVPHMIGVGSAAPSVPLPPISDPAIIDGTTEPDYASAGHPVVELDGSGIDDGDATNDHGFYVPNGGTTIRGLAIGGFGGAGIYLDGNTTPSNANLIELNHIGTDATGMLDRGVGADAVHLLSSSNNDIIDNVISGNGGYGVAIFQGIGGSADNDVSGNLIGVAADGASPIGNDDGGIDLDHTEDTDVGPDNIIAANGGPGVELHAATRDDVFGNYIGTNADGVDSLGNAGIGALLDHAVLSIVGGNDSGEGINLQANVIAGNDGDGVQLDHGSGNAIVANAIGVVPIGSGLILPNAGNGIFVADATDTQIGGQNDDDGQRGNLIGGNSGSGIQLRNAAFTIIHGNAIGTGVIGVSVFPNDEAGIKVGPGASDTIIGGDFDGRENYIANNAGDGIEVDTASTGVVISRNRLHSNGELAIDLVDADDLLDGVTPNDAGDGDTGANQLQNFPVIESAVINSGNTTITGRLESVPYDDYTIELFSSPTCDPSDYGEGKTFLGTLDVTDNGGGQVNFVFDSDLPVEGDAITATATHSGRGTSEFSLCADISGPPGFSEIRTVSANASAPSAGVQVTNDGAEPSWGPDGNIAFVRDDGLYTIDHEGAAGTEETVANTVGGDFAPARGGGGVMAFVRHTGGDADVWLIRGGVTISAAITDARPENVRASVWYRCPAPLDTVTSVLFVGLESDEIEGSTAQFQINFDPSLSCKDGQFIITATDGIDRAVSAPLTPIDVAFPQQDPVAARHAPLQDQTFLESEGVAFEGIGWDADDGVIIGRWYTASSSAPGNRTLVGSGELIDHRPFDVGCYIVTLVVTDASGHADEDSANICVIADSDSDGFSDADEQTAHACFADGAENDPRTPYQDADLDGIPNGEDSEPCTKATSYRAFVDFDPDTLNYPSTGKSVTVAITVPYRSVGDIKTMPLSSVRLTEIAGNPIPATDTRFWITGFEIRNGVLNVKFDRQLLLKYLQNERGIINQYVSIEVSGTSKDGTWSFSGTDGFLLIPAN